VNRVCLLFPFLLVPAVARSIIENQLVLFARGHFAKGLLPSFTRRSQAAYDQTTPLRLHFHLALQVADIQQRLRHRDGRGTGQVNYFGFHIENLGVKPRNVKSGGESKMEVLILPPTPVSASNPFWILQKGGYKNNLK